MFSLFSDFLEHANEIVFDACDIYVYANLQSFLERNAYRMTKKYQTSNVGEILIFENEDRKVLVCQEQLVDAIFVYIKKMDTIIHDYLKRCPRCDSVNIIEKIPYSFATKKDLEQVEQGALGFLPGAYDRKGVPIPNWKCKECGLGWHNKEDLIKRYKNQN